MAGAVMSLPILKFHKPEDMYSRSTSTMTTQTFDEKRESLMEKKFDTQVYVSDFFCTDFKKGLIFLKNRNVCISLKNKLYFCHSLKKMKVIHLCKKRTYLPIACIPFFKIIILQEYNKDSIHFSC